MTSNLKYKTDQISEYYGRNRVQWSEFYPSERAVFEKISPLSTDHVLDVGCGCGGLGLALKERFNVSNYTGVEINSAAAKLGRQMLPDAEIIEADILECQELASTGYDLVVSLSCIDWNVEFQKMFTRLFSFVKPGGYVICSFRVTLGCSTMDAKDSYQLISFGDNKGDEVAPYVVLNIHDLWRMFRAEDLSEIISCGYWGRPSDTAVTPHDEVCFVVCALQKGDANNSFHYDLELPKDVMNQLIL